MSEERKSILDSDVLAAIRNSLIPAGAIFPFGGSTIPSEYLECDGSAVSRTTYSDLFAIIGTTWGVGDGSTTFNLPDLRGAFLRGTGSHGSETMADGNPFAGPSVGSFEDDQFQGHYHEVTDAQGTELSWANGATTGRQMATVDTSEDENYRYQAQDIITDGSNGTPRTGDETKPFAAGVKYIIKI